MANRSKVEGRTGKAVDPRHRHHIAGADGLQHAKQLAAVSLRAARLLPVDLGAAFRLQLLKLSVEGLAVGADAGITEAAVYGGLFLLVSGPSALSD